MRNYTYVAVAALVVIFSASAQADDDWWTASNHTRPASVAAPATPAAQQPDGIGDDAVAFGGRVLAWLHRITDGN